MQSITLPPQDWQKLLRHFSRAPSTQKVTIEIASSALGAHREAENAELVGISFDARNNTLAIRAGDVEHMVEDPQSLEVAHTGTDVLCLSATSKDDVKHLVHFVPPLHLPDLLMR